MDHSFLDLPVELVILILSFLPIQALLRFGQTCRHFHTLANTNLHTLTFGIHTSKLSGIISNLLVTQYPQPKAVSSAFLLLKRSSPNTSPSSLSSGQSSRVSSLALWPEDSPYEDDPHSVSFVIPRARTLDYFALLYFHTTLTKSIMARHGHGLRHLDLSLWTLTIPVARTISSFPGLRTLSIRIETFHHMRAVPRVNVALQRQEQYVAWELLTRTAVFAPRLNALRIEGAELTTAQLSQFLRASHSCSELWLCKCPLIREGFWTWLGREWEGRASLEILGVMTCGGALDQSLNIVGQLKGLKFLSVQGCSGIDSEEVERRNREEWRIPELIPPVPKAPKQDKDMGMEVDAAFITVGEE